MNELNFPKIYDKEELIGYGGNQDWFKDSWAQKAGCASVLAANLFAYYQGKTKLSKNEFVSIMNEMYKYITPGKMGYPFLYKFARTFSTLMDQKGYDLKPIYKKKSKTCEEALDFVIQSIEEKHPVGVLILYHNAPELEEDNWHWVCISGCRKDEEKTKIIFSDCGERREIDADILFDLNCKNVVKMVRMK